MTARVTPYRLLTALAVSLALLLAGCASLPMDETVRQGRPVLGQPVQDVRVLPDGPAEDAAPADIVSGFLRANPGFQDDHEVARLFLTEELARQWRPTEQVLVYEGDFELEPVGEDAVDVAATVRGRVDTDGYLTEQPAGTRQRSRFSLAQEDGEWRISAFPEDFGVWLTAVDFERNYRPAAVHYAAPARDVLVPDVRWFARGDGLATALARALVRPVPAYLEGAVVSAVPPGSDLAAGAVPVDPATGVATVDLRGTGIAGEDEQRRQLYAQFVATLGQAPGVSAVQLQFGGQLLEVAGTDEPVRGLSEVGFGPAVDSVPFALLRVAAELSAVDPYHFLLQDYRPQEDEPPVPPLPDVPVRWRSLATDTGVDQLAAVSADGTALWRWDGGEQVVREGIGADLTAPAFDRLGGLWVAGRSTRGPQVWAIDTTASLDSVAAVVEAPWLEQGTEIVQLQVAPDDQRAVLHLRESDTGADRLALVGIVRSSEGRPASLTEPVSLAPTLVSVSAVQWLSTTSVAVLGRTAEDVADQPYILQVGGWLQGLSPVDEAVGIRAVPSDAEVALMVLDARGRILTQDGNTWSVARNGDDLVVPGN